jgi:hypothetical protein
MVLTCERDTRSNNGASKTATPHFIEAHTMTILELHLFNEIQSAFPDKG